MRFHCNGCKHDFTTFSERDIARKFALMHIVLDKMSCPNCHASNYHLVHKTRKTGRGRGYAGWGGSDYERQAPMIVISPLCQKRLTGNIVDGTLRAACEGCKSVFNCWSGNVDDGVLETDDKDYIAKQKAETIIKAKEQVAKKQREDELRTLTKFRQKLSEQGLYYIFQKEAWYARFAGTIWRLEQKDIAAIREQIWNTEITQAIKTTLERRNIPINAARSLLYWEIKFRNQGA